MNREDIIRSIVATYELPPGREERIVAAAIINIRKLAINGFQSIYDYVAYLVEIFQGGEIYYKLRKDLDAPASHESDKLLHEIIGADDPNFVRFTEDEPETPISQLSAMEVTGILQDVFNDEEIALIRDLFSRIENAGDIRFNMDAREVRERAQEIKERLLEIAGAYKRGASIVLPAKEISEINFHPLRIDFRHRYIRDPLAFFNQHLDIYGGMDAQELAVFDRGLYDKLVQTSQLRAALAREPSDRNDSAEEEKTAKVSAALANLGEHWQDADNIVILPFRGHESPLAYFHAHQDEYGGMDRWHLYKNDRSLYNALLSSRQLDDAIPKGHNHFRGYDSPLAYFQAHYEEFKGVGRSQLNSVDPYFASALYRNRQMDEAIPEKRSCHPRELDEGKIAEIVAAHEKYGGNACKAAAALGMAHWTVYNYWKAAGLQSKGKGAPPSLSDEKQQEIIAAYYTYEGCADKSAKALGRTHQTIAKYWKAAGLHPRGRRGRQSSLSEDERSIVLAAYGTYQGNVMEAARVLKYKQWIVRICWKAAGLQPKGKPGRKSCKFVPPVLVPQEATTEIQNQGDCKRTYKKLTPEDIEGIVAVHLFAQGHVATAVEIYSYKYKPHQVRKCWKTAGLATERDSPSIYY